MGYKGPINSGAAVGGDGVATANSTTPTAALGALLRLYIKYNLTPPAGTTDVTIATAGTDAPAQTILTITNAATSGWFYPRVESVDNTGSATGVYELFILNDKVTVTIGGANANDNADVTLDMANL